MSAAERMERAYATAQDAVRVMVVDDSAVVRTLVGRWIDDEPGLQLVGSARTGREALIQLDRADPDVVILDIEMPDLDGLAALPLLLRRRPDLVVIMASGLNRKHAEHSMKALSLGAADYVAKPGTSRHSETTRTFRHELTDKVRQLGWSRKRLKVRPHQGAASAAQIGQARPTAALYDGADAAKTTRLRPLSKTRPTAIVVGASTGGPPAITNLLTGLAPALRHTPILIAQHMPASFTTIFAKSLARGTGLPAYEPLDGDPIQPGQIYVAPGGVHMTVARGGADAHIALDDGPPEHYCKPAVDPLFASAGQVWGPATLAIILTGMGADGTRGAAAIADAGGSVIAQDEKTSTIWGMPGSAVHAGVCSAVLPLNQIGAAVRALVTGARA
jgi:two-component system, chemotaxis family, protein-glutamate methylesterase/glutaminase